MAESPSHKFGQIIGNLLEELLLPTLLGFCEERELFLDRHGDRVGVRKGKKVSWEDKYGNSHDLDFVIEKGGSANKRGRPVAFIEAAWRRYTKHSRNKAQEIQGAVLPIAEKYAWDRPFLGAVIAGVFTEGSIAQLKSVGFEVLYLPYPTVVHAFHSIGLNVEFDENTPDHIFQEAVESVGRLSREDRDAVKSYLYQTNAKLFEAFFTALKQKLDRIIDRLRIIPLFGDEVQFESVTDAKQYITSFDEKVGDGPFRKYEIAVDFSNGDRVEGMFQTKANLFDFLRYVAG